MNAWLMMPGQRRLVRGGQAKVRMMTLILQCVLATQFHGLVALISGAGSGSGWDGAACFCFAAVNQSRQACFILTVCFSWGRGGDDLHSTVERDTDDQQRTWKGILGDSA